MADPAFMQKLVLEQMITVSSSLIYEAKDRGGRFWQELDLVAVNVMRLSAGEARGCAVGGVVPFLGGPQVCCGVKLCKHCDVLPAACQPCRAVHRPLLTNPNLPPPPPPPANMALVYLMAPTRAARIPRRFAWQNMLDNLPNNVFEVATPLREYTTRSRAAAFLTKSAELCGVGMLAGAVQSALAQAAVVVRRRCDPAFSPSMPVPSVQQSALGFATAQGTFGNLRYQLVAGIDRCLFDSPTSGFTWPFRASSSPCPSPWATTRGAPCRVCPTVTRSRRPLCFAWAAWWCVRDWSPRQPAVPAAAGSAPGRARRSGAARRRGAAALRWAWGAQRRRPWRELALPPTLPTHLCCVICLACRRGHLSMNIRLSPTGPHIPFSLPPTWRCIRLVCVCVGSPAAQPLPAVFPKHVARIP